jgi:putative hydroxymethylpyrimidine transport system permease protein
MSSRRLLSVLLPLTLLLALLGLWELYVDLGEVNPLVLPAPHAAVIAFWHNARLIGENLLVTAQTVGLGLLLALAVGFLVAFAIHFSAVLRRAVYPLAVGSQAIPFPALGPLLVFWWGFGILPKLVVVVMICFFPVLVTTVDGLSSVDPDQLKLLRTLDASRWQVFRFVELPAALPAAISGTRIAVAVGIIGAYIAEVTTAGTSAGLGHEIQIDLTALQTDRAWAAMAVLFVFAISCFYTLALAERRLAPWSYKRKGDTR